MKIATYQFGKEKSAYRAVKELTDYGMTTTVYHGMAKLGVFHFNDGVWHAASMYDNYGRACLEEARQMAQAHPEIVSGNYDIEIRDGVAKITEIRVEEV